MSIATRPTAVPTTIPRIAITGANWKLTILVGCAVVVVVLLMIVGIIVEVINSVTVYPNVER